VETKDEKRGVSGKGFAKREVSDLPGLTKGQACPAAPANAPGPEEEPVFDELSVLFPLLTIYTVAYMALLAAEFVLAGLGVNIHPPTGLMHMYVALLAGYAADKELRRWTGRKLPQRKGTAFVYLWVSFLLVAGIVTTFWPQFSLPGNLTMVALQVFAIFFGSGTSKFLRERRAELDPDVYATRQEIVMELIGKSGRTTNREVAEKLGVSGATAKRMLSTMLKAGLIKRVGATKGAYYVINGP